MLALAERRDGLSLRQVKLAVALVEEEGDDVALRRKVPLVGGSSFQELPDDDVRVGLRPPLPAAQQAVSVGRGRGESIPGQAGSERGRERTVVQIAAMRGR